MIIGKLIPAATGLKRYRTIEIDPSEPVPLSTPPEAEAELLQRWRRSVGRRRHDLSALGLTFGGQPWPTTW